MYTFLREINQGYDIYGCIYTYKYISCVDVPHVVLPMVVIYPILSPYDTNYNPINYFLSEAIFLQTQMIRLIKFMAQP